jgi:hypothetical protein
MTLTIARKTESQSVDCTQNRLSRVAVSISSSAPERYHHRVFTYIVSLQFFRWFRRILHRPSCSRPRPISRIEGWVSIFVERAARQMAGVGLRVRCARSVDAWVQRHSRLSGYSILRSSLLLAMCPDHECQSTDEHNDRYTAYHNACDGTR